jgi:hypothetical protein
MIQQVPAKVFREQCKSDKARVKMEGWLPSAGPAKEWHKLPTTQTSYEDKILGKPVPTNYSQKVTVGR